MAKKNPALVQIVYQLASIFNKYLSTFVDHFDQTKNRFCQIIALIRAQMSPNQSQSGRIERRMSNLVQPFDSPASFTPRTNLRPKR